MKHILKDNLSLILGLSIPVLMIIFVAGSIYLPALFAPKPQINFIYESKENAYYGGETQYSVKNRKIIKNNIKFQEVPPRLFIHDVSKNESREVPFEEAQLLDIDSRSKSSDGYQIIDGMFGGGSLFFSGSYDRGRYLSGHGLNTKISFPADEAENINYKFHFLGWIK